MNLKTYIEEYQILHLKTKKEQHNYEILINKFNEFMVINYQKTFFEADVESVKKFTEELINEGKQESYIEAIGYRLQAFYDYLMRDKMIVSLKFNPFKTIERIEKDNRIFERSCINMPDFYLMEDYFKELGTETLAIFYLIFPTGLKLHEIRDLQREDIYNVIEDNKETGIIAVRPKNRGTMAVAIPERCNSTIEKHIESLREKSYLFTKKGKEDPYKDIWFITKLLRDMNKACKLSKHYTSTNLRYSIGMIEKIKGMDDNMIAQRLGYTSTVPTKRFITSDRVVPNNLF